MITSKLLRASVLAATLCAVGALCLAGCSNDESNKGAIAATLGETTIYESDVTAQIEAIRLGNGYTDDATWAMVLSMYGYTPESFREDVIKDLTLEEVIPAAALQAGVTVADADIDAAIKTMKDNYQLTDDQWEATLTSSGFTVESYRRAVELGLMQDALFTKVTADLQVSDDYFAEHGMAYVTSSFSNIKRSSHILFALEDKALAEEVLAKLQAGEITWEEAVVQYSIDLGSAVNNGDVGWSGVNTFVDAYQVGLDALAVDEMSGLVESEFGYHIIICTDAFVANENTTAAAVPTDVKEYIKSAYLQSSLKSTTYADFVDEVRNGLGFTINAMPAGLSYDVDATALLSTSVADSGEGAQEGETSEAAAA